MADSIAVCTGTITNDLNNTAVCSVGWSSGPYTYSPSISSQLSVADMVEISWGVAACLIAAWLFKIMGRSA